MKRSRRPGAKWTYATDTTFLLNNQSANLKTIQDWILPPGRVDWMIENGARKRDSITFAGCHMWLDFWWSTPPSSGSSSNQVLPDVDFYLVRTQAEGTGATPNSPAFISPTFSPWDEPQVPGLVLDWEESTEEDGTAPLLWTHHIKGECPPNAIVRTDTNIGPTGAQYNCNNYISQDGSGGNYCRIARTFSVRAEWQPDVIVRAKRRLKKGDGIAIFMAGNWNSVVSANFDVHARVLTRG